MNRAPKWENNVMETAIADQVLTERMICAPATAQQFDREWRDLPEKLKAFLQTMQIRKVATKAAFPAIAFEIGCLGLTDIIEIDIELLNGMFRETQDLTKVVSFIHCEIAAVLEAILYQKENRT
jgi:hypothetical protein